MILAMDKGQQASTLPQSPTEVDVVPVPFEMLTPQQQAWVDFNVVQGVVVHSDGEMEKIPVTKFADTLGVNRTTCYNWSKNIPNFWDLVEERRQLIFDGARTAKVWNALFLNATVKMNVTAQTVWLHNANTKFNMPNQTVKHDVEGGLMDVLEIARQRRLSSINVQDGEVIDADS